MDALGFGLENYDAIGAWRTRDGKFPVDSAGTLPGGKTFRGSSGLKAILKSDSEAFAQCLTEKMLTYALGRGVEPFDRPAIDSIARRLASGDYRFSRLVLEIANSLPSRCEEEREENHHDAPRITQAYLLERIGNGHCAASARRNDSLNFRVESFEVEPARQDGIRLRSERHRHEELDARKAGD
jgi:hypothetical protein